MTRFTQRLLLMPALLAALALAISACGGDDDGEDASTTEGSAQTTEQTTSTSEDAAEPVSSEPKADLPELSGIATQVIFDQSFVDALADLELSPGVSGDGKMVEDPARAKFPITGGSVKYFDPASDVRPYVQGSISHDGSGLTLSSEGTQVELSDFLVDPGASTINGNVSVNGEAMAEGALLFDLDGTTLEPLKVNKSFGAAVLEGTTVKLSQEGADLLNEAFGTEALSGGAVVGVSKITIALPEE